MKKPKFPPPPKPLSFKKTFHKITEDHEYAEFLHGLILSARGGDDEATKLVFKYFEPTVTELDKLRLPRKLLKMKDVHDLRCTTGWMLIDFAAPQHIW